MFVRWWWEDGAGKVFLSLEPTGRLIEIAASGRSKDAPGRFLPPTGGLSTCRRHCTQTTVPGSMVVNVAAEDQAPQGQSWIAVGELADSFASDANLLPPVDDLAGRDFALMDEAAGRTQLRIARDACTVTDAGGTRRAGLVATSLRPDVYLLDIRDPAAPRRTLVVVLDLAVHAATIVEAQLPEPTAVDEPLFRRARRGVPLTSVTGRFRAASIDRPFDPATAHPPTRDLVGLRLRHRYNAGELYEHVYLNERRYCWHCLEGSEQSLADVDECDFRKIRDGLYLFAWREKLIPTFGLVLMDLDALRTTGKIMGFKDDTFETVTHFSVGALSKIVNRVPAGL